MLYYVIVVQEMVENPMITDYGTIINHVDPVYKLLYKELGTYLNGYTENRFIMTEYIRQLDWIDKIYEVFEYDCESQYELQLQISGELNYTLTEYNKLEIMHSVNLDTSLCLTNYMKDKIESILYSNHYIIQHCISRILEHVQIINNVILDNDSTIYLKNMINILTYDYYERNLVKSWNDPNSTFVRKYCDQNDLNYIDCLWDSWDQTLVYKLVFDYLIVMRYRKDLF